MKTKVAPVDFDNKHPDLDGYENEVMDIVSHL